ncbi:MAG: YbjN domain-containing protein [Alphaproteobacteria bacterium]|nr:YbjN domain-containing protein [Alphaproteobacteria bacterium]
MLAANRPYTSFNPIDTVQTFFNGRSVEFERRNLNEIVAEVQGKWQNMLLFFAWEERLKCLQISCFINIQNKICDTSRIFELLALINADLWLGHFSYWTEHQTPVFKHTVIVDFNDTCFEQKMSQIIDIAINECERMYPVFQAVMAQNIDPKQVLRSLSGSILQ